MLDFLLFTGSQSAPPIGGAVEYSMIYNRRQTSYGTSRSYNDVDLGLEATDREIALLIVYNKSGTAHDRYLTEVSIAGVNATISDGIQFEGVTTAIGFARATVPAGTTSQNLTVTFNDSISVGAFVLYRITGRASVGQAPTMAVHGAAGNVSGEIDINLTIPAEGIAFGILGASGWTRTLNSAPPFNVDLGASGSFFSYSWDRIGEATIETDIQFYMSSYSAGFRYGIYALNG